MPSRESSSDPRAKPVPAAPSGSDPDLAELGSSADHHDDDGGDGEEEYIGARGAHGSDPYANLDNAFGGYSADEPKPHTDNLLF